MTHQIKKSVIDLPDADLRIHVQNFADELKQWTENMALYEEEQKTPPPEEPVHSEFETDEDYTQAYVAWGEAVSLRRQRYPAPEAHPDIMEAVNKETFAPDYEVVDDLPKEEPPPPELETLKTKYLAEVGMAEQIAISALVPAGKVRARNLRAMKIRQAEADARAKLHQKRALLKETDVEAVSLDAKIKEPTDKNRSPEDRKFMDEQNAIHARYQAISERAAQMLSDIEDLTEDNVHSWTLGSFE